jgi:hypothetical protein
MFKLQKLFTGSVIAAAVAALTVSAANANGTRVVASTVALAGPAAVVVHRPLVTGYIPVPAPTVFEVIDAPMVVAARVVTPRVATVVRSPVVRTTSFGLAAAPVAWTSEWYAYCAARYHSFDPATGTYLSFSGVRRMCR